MRPTISRLHRAGLFHFLLLLPPTNPPPHTEILYQGSQEQRRGQSGGRGLQWEQTERLFSQRNCVVGQIPAHFLCKHCFPNASFLSIEQRPCKPPSEEHLAEADALQSHVFQSADQHTHWPHGSRIRESTTMGVGTSGPGQPHPSRLEKGLPVPLFPTGQEQHRVQNVDSLKYLPRLEHDAGHASLSV